MSAKTFAARSDDRRERLDLRIAWLCGVTLLLEGCDIAAAGSRRLRPVRVAISILEHPASARRVTAPRKSWNVNNACRAPLRHELWNPSGDHGGRSLLTITTVLRLGVAAHFLCCKGCA